MIRDKRGFRSLTAKLASILRVLLVPTATLIAVDWFSLDSIRNQAATTGMSQMQQAMQDINQVATQNLASTRQAEAAVRDLDLLGGRLKETLSGYGV